MDQQQDKIARLISKHGVQIAEYVAAVLGNHPQLSLHDVTAVLVQQNDKLDILDPPCCATCYLDLGADGTLGVWPRKRAVDIVRGLGMTMSEPFPEKMSMILFYPEQNDCIGVAVGKFTVTRVPYAPGGDA